MFGDDVVIKVVLWRRERMFGDCVMLKVGLEHSWSAAVEQVAKRYRYLRKDAKDQLHRYPKPFIVFKTILF
jgi:hypothetical protein